MRKLIQTTALLLASMSANATTFGPVENFDVVNDDPQGRTARGFEIVMHGVTPSDITSIFGDASRWTGMERYGIPTITVAGDATVVTYKANYVNGAWSVGTGAGHLAAAPADSCWPLGDASYNTTTYPCDHFGVSTSKVATSVEYNWLFESTPGTLVQVVSSVPAPVWNVQPQPPIQPAPVNGVVQAPIPQPPIVAVKIRAPEVDAYHPEFGEPRWVKVTATGAPVRMEVGDLVQNNQVIKEAKKQVQVEWQLIQTDAGNPAAGNVDLSGVKLDNNVQSVVYTFEYYDYIGDLDPATGEAKPRTSDTPVQPDPADLGNFKVIQMAAVNLDGAVAPPPAPAPIAPLIDNAIANGVIGVPYSQVVNVTAGDPNDTVVIAVKNLPASLAFDPLTKTISGTPDFVKVGNQITIQADDLTNNTTTSVTTSFDINGVGIDFLPTPPAAVVGELYSYQLTSTGGYGAITYTATPLPAGLTLTGDTISGIPLPAAVGATPVIFGASDNYGDSIANILVNFYVDPSPVATACSGTNENVNNISPRAGWVSTLQGAYPIKYPNAANTTFAPGVNTFGVGYVTSYVGLVDQTGVFCVANTMEFALPLNVATPTFVKGQVGSAYPATPITVTGGWSPYTTVVAGLPSGLTFDGANVVGTPAVSGTFPVTVSVTDNKGNGFNITTLSITVDPKPVVVPPPAPAPSCTKPAGAKSATAHAKATAVSGKTVTVSGKVFTIADCATIVYKGKAQSIVVGYDVDVKTGYVSNGNVATYLIVDDGK